MICERTDATGPLSQIGFRFAARDEKSYYEVQGFEAQSVSKQPPLEPRRCP